MTGTDYFIKKGESIISTNGGGDSQLFEDESKFTFYYANELAHLLDAGQPESAIIKEDERLIAIHYADKWDPETKNLRGLISNSNTSLSKAMSELSMES
ncbi:hypothetical protein [Persicirhabdus sediminis]|uniref:Uncharacterized protein n=1 Tax=Persicirhabdus sediminis TaxID=454144 RepID=A0A8J7SLM8_9BACT|nr:hypothetical protein [Persicirhabdus sediminis]MBK1790503.1 hypothetical protein [Persicirhabdus sediminis]